MKAKWYEKMPHTVYLGLGTNLGNREANLKKAAERIGQIPETSLIKASTLFDSAALGHLEQGRFLNQVMALLTTLSPEAFFQETQAIEKKLGRIKSLKWGPRIIDLDMLFYDDLIIQTEQLTLPHKEIQNRAFVLLPLLELAPTLIHPTLQTSLQTLALKVLSQDIKKYQPQNNSDFGNW